MAEMGGGGGGCDGGRRRREYKGSSNDSLVDESATLYADTGKNLGSSPADCFSEAATTPAISSISAWMECRLAVEPRRFRSFCGGGARRW